MSREQELFEKLKSSEYIFKYSKSIMEQKKEDCIKILINYLALKNILGVYPCPAKTFDIIYVYIFNEKQEFKKISNIDLEITENRRDLRIQDYIFFILDFLQEKLEDEGKFFWGTSGIKYEKFKGILEIHKESLVETKGINVLKNYTEIIKKKALEDSFNRKKIGRKIYENVDRDELEKVPENLLEVDKEELEKIKKKIVDISLKEGKFKTYNSFKGSKVENVTNTREIEDFGDFLSSSLMSIKKNKTIFLKQLLEKEILKVEKPLKVQSNKKFKLDFYLENSSLSQEIINLSQDINGRKTIYFNKILSTILISDLCYIFSNIKHWSLNISYNYIPVSKGESSKENFHIINIKNIMNSLNGFVDVDNFQDIYINERENFSKFIFNTINHGEIITNGISYLKDTQKKEFLNKNIKNVKELSIIFILGKNKDEINKKIYDLNRCKDITTKYIFALNIERQKIIFREEEYELKNSYSNLRGDFLNEMVAFFGGRN